MVMMPVRFMSAILAMSFLVLVVGCAPKEDAGADSPTSTSGVTPPARPDVAVAPSPIKYAEVQKIFDAKCVGCHGTTTPKAGLSLTSYDGLMKGTGQGPAVTPGDATGSLLVQVITATNGKPQMPPKNPLPQDQIQLIEDWIIAGAKNDS